VKKSNVYKSEPLTCDVCGKNLFDNPGMSIIVFHEDADTRAIKDIKVCCKGDCDRILKSRRPKDYIDGWREVTEFTNPYLYIKNVVAVLNNLQSGEQKFDDEAFKKYKNIILNCYPYVCRDLDQNEMSTAEFESMLPF
jgi:hypothetical protein